MSNAEQISPNSPPPSTTAPKRLYSVELLRVLFILSIVVFHVTQKSPSIKNSLLSFFHATYQHLGFGADLFFVIGGFFLYKRVIKPISVGKTVYKIYGRLLPGLLFAFLVCVIIHSRSFSYLPLVLSMSGVSGLFKSSGDILGWGDWFMYTYFWCCCLYIVLFSFSFRLGILSVLILSYFTIALRLHADYPGWGGVYYTIIGADIIRGVYGIGIGLIAAHISRIYPFRSSFIIKSICTALEIYLLVLVLGYLVGKSAMSHSFWEIELYLALLLIICDGSRGWISTLFNNFKFIQHFSKYTYSILIGHIVTMNFVFFTLNKPNNWTSLEGTIVIGAGIVLAIMEYHFVEKWLVSKIKNYLHAN